MYLYYQYLTIIEHELTNHIVYEELKYSNMTLNIAASNFMNKITYKLYNILNENRKYTISLKLVYLFDTETWHAH